MSPKKYDKQKEFYNKKSHLEHRLKKDILKNGIARIPCRVESLEDVISRYSVRGSESVDPELADYIMGFVDCVPKGYPVVLEIHGPKFTEEEQKLITDLITADADFLLGKTEADNKGHRKVFWWMAIGTIVSGILLAFIKKIITDEVPVEFFYVLFWLFADALVRYLFIEFHDYKNDKIRAGRLASMKIEFVED